VVDAEPHGAVELRVVGAARLGAAVGVANNYGGHGSATFVFFQSKTIPLLSAAVIKKVKSSGDRKQTRR
jgi:hypothetical protein